MSNETHITTLNIQPGTVVLVQGHHEEIDFEALEELAQQTGCTVLCLPPGVTIEVMDDHAMAGAGWVRATPPEPLPPENIDDQEWRTC
jgi:hypothetical protein